MNTFAFMIHPIEIGDIARKFGPLGKLPPRLVESLFKYAPPLKVSQITGVRSKHAQTEGWFVACPITSRLMIDLPEEYVIKKIIKTGKLAQKLGAKILGLGAFTSVVGDAGITIDKNLDIAVTTGNSYTVATAVEGAREAAALMGHNLKRCHAVVVGATGSIGRVCASLLARDVHALTLVAREKTRLEELAHRITYESGVAPRITSDIRHALHNAQIVITVTSAVDTIIGAEDLMPGAVVCDVSRPRNVSREVAEKRNDVLVIEGGVVEVPGQVNFNFNFGFPPGMSYACMAETMMLSMEGRYESFSLGRDMSLQQVEEISALARKHGFKLAGFRSFERAVTREQIARIRENARHALNTPRAK
ncbi:Predicted amino acid dehydrogenase [Desulfotomaculum arcticum]|uniref:Predicted amino acid dehydrogenase n=1 Tax=Desulfotruncus arcticus DSM 17038 TaxID=1121424 RepID=A0A1I2XCT2_9FIRM|nr:NAD(P)H-binding protein [Desulfotruncus arcticus]SFH09811.1 Predicted amino acid dehydrogenase [Desulfotomaculum arcticum] [Desulfotruncus arcticus DSM 17038]